MHDEKSMFSIILERFLIIFNERMNAAVINLMKQATTTGLLSPVILVSFQVVIGVHV